jgi:glycosyltransferase involved in cell wall biosynthesis
MVSKLRMLWRRLPIPYAVRARISPLYGIALAQLTRGRRTPPLAPAKIGRGPLIVSGLLSDVTGIGRAGRMTVDKLGDWGVPMHVHDLRGDPAGTTLEGVGPGGVWVCHCNAPQVLEVLAHGTDRLWASRYRIGYWAYELEELPADWQAVIPYFHEIWTPSQFVANAVKRSRRAAGVSVRVMPHPLPAVAGTVRKRELIGFEGRFAFLAMFDGRSSFARKNPAGALSAFQQAFGRDDDRVGLVIKVVAPDADPASLRQLQSAAEGWENVRFITSELSDAEAVQVIASADCLVSLHRSEGFGLTIAEAMALGTPVIATDWSGNVDFSRGGVAGIPYRLVPTVDPSGRYAQRGARWAEPDLVAAAEAMRRLRTDAALRNDLVATARRLIEERLGGPYDRTPYLRFLASGVDLTMAAE